MYANCDKKSVNCFKDELWRDMSILMTSRAYCFCF